MTQNATVWLPYAQMQTIHTPLAVCKTQGSILTLTDGRELIDGVASWWTACHGYNHPKLIHAICHQANSLAHVMLGGLIHEGANQLATRLGENLPGDLKYVFYSESGSVAVEIAMKMALQFWINKGAPQRSQFVYFQHGYHGDTFFTMSVSDPQDGIHPPFEDMLPKHCLQKIPQTPEEFAAFESWLQEHHEKVAALLIEPLVQGAGGMKMYEAKTLEILWQICQRYDVLFIVDEIFTAFGRTGSLFAIDQANITPDIICLSKALSGGTLPLAATIANKKVYDAFLDQDYAKALMHGTTFMGNALACAAAIASLDLFTNEPRLAQVADIEGMLKSALMPLQNVAGVKTVRVKGAIGCVELAYPIIEDLNWFKLNFIEQGVWCRPFGNIVYTTPALTINSDELEKITATIVKLIKQWSATRYRK
ncbi:MAG: adenosylmethionine--8-amino-7-oxononanoate transaminase [Proteobacteria bacterium]|nr:adenosylmethionine--8-amino-7-oxononanoate transaminase [Pseudomonadota bacterium]